MTVRVTDEQAREWADTRCDDAGRCAADLLETRAHLRAVIEAGEAYLKEWNQRAGEYLDDCPCHEPTVHKPRIALHAAISAARKAVEP